MKTNKLTQIIIDALNVKQGKDITEIDVKGLCDFTDTMIIGSGTSDRHVKTLTDHVISTVKHIQHDPIRVEGQDYNEWIIIDLGNTVVHIMKEDCRDLYQLEALWKSKSPHRQSHLTSSKASKRSAS